MLPSASNAFVLVAHTITVCYYSDCRWQIQLSIPSLLYIKPAVEVPALQPCCSPSPHTHSSRWVVFFSPACHSPATVPSATCDSSSTWPPAPPLPPPFHLNPPQTPHHCLRTPCNKLGTFVMSLLAQRPANPNDYLGGVHVHTTAHR